MINATVLPAPVHEPFAVSPSSLKPQASGL